MRIEKFKKGFGVYFETCRAPAPSSCLNEFYLLPAFSIQWWDLGMWYIEVGLKVRWGFWYIEAGLIKK